MAVGVASLQSSLKMDVDYVKRQMDKAGYSYEVTDPDGNFMSYRIYQGHRYNTIQMPEDIPKRMEAIRNLNCRDDDIILATYPKSGTHWLANIVSMIVRGKTEYVGTPPIVEFANFDDVDKMVSPRILVSHLAFECLPKGFQEGKNKIITVTRNPKDAVTSLYAFGQAMGFAVMLKGSFSSFLHFFLNKHFFMDSWFDYVKMWGPANQQYPEKEILFLQYEDIKKDLYKHIVRVAEFLGYQRSEEFYREVEMKCTFKNMQRDVNNGRQPQQELMNVVKSGVLPIYRKGKVGDWKNWFTVADSELFDKVYNDEMTGCDVSEVYKEITDNSN